MTTDIQLLRSGVAFKRPAVAPLLEGQAAVNTNPAEPGLFFKNSEGTALIKIGPTAVNTTGFAPNANAVGSTGNSVGEMWLDGRAAFANPTMKVWNGLAWNTSNGFDVNDTTGEFSFANLLTVQTLESNGTGADSYLRLPQDSTTARAAIAPSSGMIRFNTTTLAFEGYNGSTWAAFSLSGTDIVINDLSTTGDTTLGDNCAADSLIVNSTTQINCNTTIGASNSNTLTIESVFASNLIPDGPGTRRLGSSTARWSTFASDLNVTSVTTDLIPAIDNTQDLGTAALRWANIYASDLNVATSLVPAVDNTIDLGSPSLRWANIYTGDLHFSNEGSDGNDIDGTTGNWTLQEGDDNMYFINNRTGAKFRVVMESVG